MQYKNMAHTIFTNPINSSIFSVFNYRYFCIYWDNTNICIACLYCASLHKCDCDSRDKCNFSIIDPLANNNFHVTSSLLFHWSALECRVCHSALYWHSGARVEENTLVTHLFCLAHLYSRAIYLRVACTRAVLHCWWHNAAVLRIHKINAKRVQVQQQGRHSSRSPIRSANDNLPLYMRVHSRSVVR